MMRPPSALLFTVISSLLWITGATAQDHLWSRLYTDSLAGPVLPPPNPSGLEELKRVSGAVDFAGNSIVFGRFSGTLDFGGGALTPGDAFLAKLDASSAHVWSRRFVGDFVGPQAMQGASDPAGSVFITEQILGTVDFGGGPLSGWTVLVKFDPDGNHQWGRGFNTSSQHLGGAGSHGVATDSDGNVLLVGGYVGALDFGDGPLPVFGGVDLFVAKFDPDGNTIWSLGFGTSGDQWAMQVACDAAGDVIVTGRSTSQGFDVGGGPISIPASSGLTVVAKYSGADGSHQWSHGFRSSTFGNDWIYVATNSQSEVFLAGTYSGSIDLGGGSLSGPGNNSYIAKFEAGGAHLWSHNYPAPNANDFISMAGIKTDPTGNLYVVGLFRGTIDLGGDPISTSEQASILAASFDPLGQHRWSYGYGEVLGPNPPRVQGMVDALGNAILVVEWDGRISFGGDTFDSPYDVELFIARIGPAPTDVLGYEARFDGGLRASPNPTRDSMVLSLAARRRAVVLRILDPRGRVVRTLTSTRSTVESTLFDWDGRDDEGRFLSAGVYFATALPSAGGATRKLLVLR
jgi:hypothetical protein